MKITSRWIAGVTATAFFGTSLGFGPYIRMAEAAEVTRSGPPAAAIVGLRKGEGDLENRVRVRLSKELESSKHLLFIPEESTAKVVDETWGEDRAGAVANLEKAYKDFQEGKQLYERLALEESINALSASVRGYREGIAALRDNRFLLMSHLYLGIALIILGRESEGRKYIREMVVLDPHRKEQKLSPREFSPKILNVHRALTEEVFRGPSGRVVVDANPAGATVVWDGVVQKQAPIEITEVPVGDHFIVVEMKGYRQYSRRVVVGAGDNRVSVVLSEWSPFSPYSLKRRKELSSVDLLGRVADQLGVPVLVLAEMSRSGERSVSVTAQLFDARTKDFSKIERVDARSDKIDGVLGDLSDKLVQNMTQEGAVVAERAAPPVRVVTEEFPVEEPRSTTKRMGIIKQWWFWTAVAVVVGGGLGAYLALGRKDPGYNILNVPNPLK